MVPTEISLYYYRARYYDPQTGRHISEDPARADIDLSWYAYVQNRPTDFLDYSGQRKERPANLRPGTEEKYWRPFSDGFKEALRLINQSDCKKFFTCESGGKDPVRALNDSTYDFAKLPQGPGVGAQTNVPPREPGHVDVDINTDGVFVTGDSGIATFAGGHRVDAGELNDLRAIILLHELGHQLGIFPADTDASLNWNHTLKIIQHCAPFAHEVRR